MRSCKKNFFFNNLIVVKFGTAKFINKYLKAKNSHHTTQILKLKKQILCGVNFYPLKITH